VGGRLGVSQTVKTSAKSTAVHRGLMGGELFDQIGIGYIPPNTPSPMFMSARCGREGSDMKGRKVKPAEGM